MISFGTGVYFFTLVLVGSFQIFKKASSGQFESLKYRSCALPGYYYLFYFILFYCIVFYFILSYLILPHFISFSHFPSHFISFHFFSIGLAAGCLFSSGNFFSIYATQFLGLTIGFPLTQTALLVSGLWGLFFFKVSFFFFSRLYFLGQMIDCCEMCHSICEILIDFFYYFLFYFSSGNYSNRRTSNVFYFCVSNHWWSCDVVFVWLNK